MQGGMMRPVSPSGVAPQQRGGGMVKGPPNMAVPAGAKKMMMMPPSGSSLHSVNTMNNHAGGYGGRSPAPGGGGGGRASIVTMKSPPHPMQGGKKMMATPAMMVQMGGRASSPSQLSSVSPRRSGGPMPMPMPAANAVGASPPGNRPASPGTAVSVKSPQSASMVGATKTMMMQGTRPMPSPPHGGILIHKGPPPPSAPPGASSSLSPSRVQPPRQQQQNQQQQQQQQQQWRPGVSPVSSRPATPQSALARALGRRSPLPGAVGPSPTQRPPPPSLVPNAAAGSMSPTLSSAVAALHAAQGGPAPSPAKKMMVKMPPGGLPWMGKAPGGGMGAKGIMPGPAKMPPPPPASEGPGSQSLSSQRPAPALSSTEQLRANASRHFSPFKLLRAGSDSDSDGDDRREAAASSQPQRPPMTPMAQGKAPPANASVSSPRPPFTVINGKKVVVMGKGGPTGSSPPATLMGAKKMMMMMPGGGGGSLVASLPSLQSGRGGSPVGNASSPSRAGTPLPAAATTTTATATTAAMHSPGHGIPKGAKIMGSGPIPPPGAKIMVKGPAPPLSVSAVLMKSSPGSAPGAKKMMVSTTHPVPGPPPFLASGSTNAVGGGGGGGGGAAGDGLLRVPSTTILRDDAPEAGLAKPDTPSKAIEKAKKKRPTKNGTVAGGGRFGALALVDSDEDSSDEEETEEEEEVPVDNGAVAETTGGYDPLDHDSSPIRHQMTERFTHGYNNNNNESHGDQNTMGPLLPTGEGTILEDHNGNKEAAAEGAQSDHTDAPSPAPKKPAAPEKHTSKRNGGEHGAGTGTTTTTTTQQQQRQQQAMGHRPPPKTASSGRAKALRDEEEARERRDKEREKQRLAQEKAKKSAAAKRRAASASKAAKGGKDKDTEKRGGRGRTASPTLATPSHRHPRSASRSTITGRLSSSTASPSDTAVASVAASGTATASRTGSVNTAGSAKQRQGTSRKKDSTRHRHPRSRSSSGSNAVHASPSPSASAASSSSSSLPRGKFDNIKTSDLYRLYNLLRRGEDGDDKARRHASSRGRGSTGGTPSRRYRRRPARSSDAEEGSAEEEGNGVGGSSWLRTHTRRSPFSTSRGSQPNHDSGGGGGRRRGRSADSAQTRSQNNTSTITSLGSPGIPWRYNKKHGEPFDPPTPLSRPLGFINTGGGRYTRVGNSPYARTSRRTGANSPSSLDRRGRSPQQQQQHTDPAAERVGAARARKVVDAVQSDPLFFRTPTRTRAGATDDASARSPLATASATSPEQQQHPYCLVKPPPYVKLTKGQIPFDHLSPRRESERDPHLQPLAEDLPRGDASSLIRDAGRALDAYLQQQKKEAERREGEREGGEGRPRSPAASATTTSGASFFHQLYAHQPYNTPPRQGGSEGGRRSENAKERNGPQVGEEEVLRSPRDSRASGGGGGGGGGRPHLVMSPLRTGEGDNDNIISGSGGGGGGSVTERTSNSNRNGHHPGGLYGSLGEGAATGSLRSSTSPLIPGAVDVLSRDLAELHRNTGDKETGLTSNNERGAETDRGGGGGGGGNGALDVSRPSSSDGLLDGVPPKLPPPPSPRLGASDATKQETRSTPDVPNYARPRASSAHPSDNKSGGQPRRRSRGGSAGGALLSPPRPSSAQRRRSASAPKKFFTSAAAARLSRPVRPPVPVMSSGGGGGHASTDHSHVLAVPGVGAEKRQETKKWLDEVLSAVVATPAVAAGGQRTTGGATAAAAAGRGGGVVLVPAPGTERAGRTNYNNNNNSSNGKDGEESAGPPAKKIPIPLVDYRKDFRPRTTSGGDGGGLVVTGSGRVRSKNFLKLLDEAARADALPESPRKHIATIDFRHMQGVRSPTAGNKGAVNDSTVTASAASLSAAGGAAGGRKAIPVHVHAPPDGLPFEAYSTIKVKDPQIPSAWALAPPRDGFDFAPGKPVARKVISARSAGTASASGRHSGNDSDEDGRAGTGGNLLVQEIWMDEHRQPYVKIKEILRGDAARAQRLSVQRLSRPKPVYVRADELAGGGN